MSRTDKSRETGRSVPPAEGEWGVTANGYDVSFWCDKHVLGLETMVRQLNMLKTTDDCIFQHSEFYTL